MSTAFHFAAVAIWMLNLTTAAWHRDRLWLAVSVLAMLYLWFVG